MQRPSIAMWRIEAIQVSRPPIVGAHQNSIPLPYIAARISGMKFSQQMTARIRPSVVSKTGIVEPSLKPHMREYSRLREEGCEATVCYAEKSFRTARGHDCTVLHENDAIRYLAREAHFGGGAPRLRHRQSARPLTGFAAWLSMKGTRDIVSGTVSALGLSGLVEFCDRRAGGT